MEAIQLITRRLITRDSGLAGLLLWIPVALGRDELQAYAYTDGKCIYYCDSFFTLGEPQQLAVVIHETLHVVLRHAHRFKQIHLSQGNKFNPKIANICADAIVDRAIKNTPKIGPLEITLPYVITAENIVTPEDLKKTPAHQWNFEMLYNYMQQKVDSAIQKFLAEHGDKIDDDLQAGEGDQADTHMDEMESRIWKERFKRATAGSQPGSLLREVLKDLPDPKVPWQKHFREFMIAHVMPTTTVDWGRPSRRVLASKGKLGYYEPGIQRDIGVKKAGIVIDTSGSIDDKQLMEFISETNSIMEQTGCAIVLICADAEVQSVHEFREPIDGKYKAKGGGGTDFRPALNELKKHDIDCCVYLTDMCGAFPETKPPYPVMWATLVDQEPPFGRKVLIDHLRA
jgi:predicted metal-dependent peptidase